MKASLPFDKVIVGGEEIGASLLVSGSATLRLGGVDKSVAASDGTFAKVRCALLNQSSFRALGDFSALSTPQGGPVAVSLHLAGQEIAAFEALVSVAYDGDSRLSSFSLKSAPVTA